MFMLSVSVLICEMSELHSNFPIIVEEGGVSSRWDVHDRNSLSVEECSTE